VHPLWEVAVNVERMDGVDYCKTELKLQRMYVCVWGGGGV
jgi:hypothetical protein